VTCRPRRSRPAAASTTSLDEMAEALRVSKRGLRLRMRELGLGPRTVQ
jgi:hypothetical protein